MIGKWMTWEESIGHLKCKEPDMLDYILAGTLQPHHHNNGRLMWPPRYSELSNRRSKYRTIWIGLLNKYPSLPGSHISGISRELQDKLTHNREFDADGKPIPIDFEDGTNSKIIEQYIDSFTQADSLSKRLEQFQDPPRWTGFDLDSDINHYFTVERLQNALYLRAEILEIQRQQAEIKTDVVTDNPQLYADFIGSLKVSFLDNTEIRIINKGQPTNHACGSIGFRDSNTKEWLTFIEILRSKDNVYKLGPAHYYDKGLRKKVLIKDYSQRKALLKAINKKLLTFLTKQYGVVFPPGFNLYELRSKHDDGAYSFKFHIRQDKPSYKTKDQAIIFLKKLVRDGAPTDTINDAVQIAMESGATPDEVSEIADAC